MKLIEKLNELRKYDELPYPIYSELFDLAFKLETDLLVAERALVLANDKVYDSLNDVDEDLVYCSSCLAFESCSSHNYIGCRGEYLDYFKSKARLEVGEVLFSKDTDVGKD